MKLLDHLDIAKTLLRHIKMMVSTCHLLIDEDQRAKDGFCGRSVIHFLKGGFYK